MGSTIEIIFVIAAMSLWFLFPIGLFVAMNSIDCSVESVVKLGHDPVVATEIKKIPSFSKDTWRPHWPIFLHRFRHH